jgi:outer membrane biogenesis lipoprotein LolB
MERFIVHFDTNDIRDVLLDDTKLGPTEQVLLVDRDTYEVTLSGAQDYLPEWQDVLIKEQGGLPLPIVFKKAQASV